MLLDIWHAIEDYIPANKKDELAETLVALFLDNDEDLTDVYGEDRHLDKAIDTLVEDTDEEVDEDEY
jgi:hypothetical protein